MTLEDGRLQLTTIGKKHFGGVIALFYSPSVQKHVINLAGGMYLFYKTATIVRTVDLSYFSFQESTLSVILWQSSLRSFEHQRTS